MAAGAFRDAYRVGDKPGANWQTVAAGFGVPNVWDLIWFNFQTTDPREVNFYLHRYVGCWQSNDAKNFSFKGAEPGVIFIPPFGWKRPTPDPLMARFLSMLTASVARFPYITYKNVHISRSSFETVGLAVRNGRIGIGYDPDRLDRDGMRARCTWTYPNKFIFRDPFIDTINHRLDVVHEATHAVLDMYKGNGLQVLDNEFLAFLCGAIATETLATRGRQRCLRPGNGSGDPGDRRVANEGAGRGRRVRRGHRNRRQGRESGAAPPRGHQAPSQLHHQVVGALSRR